MLRELMLAHIYAWIFCCRYRGWLRALRVEGDQEGVQERDQRGAGDPVQQGALRQVHAVPALLLRERQRDVHRLPRAGQVHLLQFRPLPPLQEVDAQAAAQRRVRRLLRFSRPFRAAWPRHGQLISDAIVDPSAFSWVCVSSLPDRATARRRSIIHDLPSSSLISSVFACVQWRAYGIIMFSALILTRSIWAMHGDAQRISVAALFIRPFFHLYIKEINLESYPVAFPIVYSISIS